MSIYRDVYISCDVGWANLFEPLIDKCREKGVGVFLVKEKYGTLRFYTDRSDLEIDDMIDKAEEASATICERCGDAGVTRIDRGWIQTLCDVCNTTNE